MNIRLSTLCKRISRYLSLREEIVSSCPFSNEKLLLGVQEELFQAYNLFSRVHDTEMVDSAVFYMNAAEKRYSYLIKQIKSQQHNSLSCSNNME